MKFENSQGLNKYVSSFSDTCLLSFSRGKDSIGAWLELRRYFKRIIPYFLYLIPDLDFENESLKYYESFFDCHIYRLPHPSLYRWFNKFVFQAPENLQEIEKARLPVFDYDDIRRIIKEDFDLPMDTYTATGIRGADSVMRRINLSRNGALSERQKTFFPIFDWTADKLYQELQQAGVKLPIDYKLFGRTFDGMDNRFLSQIKKYLPGDYEKILKWFPIAEIEIKRFEWRAGL